ncbi:mesotocin receptor-like [Dreissena polymorpha]|nr:mesotocin receptor-like [Dreissena polymorpha]
MIIGSWIMALLIPVWMFPSIMVLLAPVKLISRLILGAVSVCYVGISVVVWNHWRSRRNLTEITEMNTTLTESTFPLRHKSMNEGLLPKINTIKMTLIICLSLFICWLPATVFNTMDLYGIHQLDHRYYIVLQRLYPLNSACNQIVFLLFSKHLLPCGSATSSKVTRCYESIGTTITTL